MPTGQDSESLERRLEAVERAVSADEHVGEELRATAADDDILSRLDTLEARVDELDAATQAIRGFLGGLDAVNESVEARADAAIAAVERLDRQLSDELDEGTHSRDDEERTPAEPDHDTAEPAEHTLRERLRDQW